MKLRDDFIFQEMDGEYLLVPAGSRDFHGIVRCNKSAGLILELLQQEITEAQLKARYAEAYGISADNAAEDVEFVLGKIRSVGALEA